MNVRPKRFFFEPHDIKIIHGAPEHADHPRIVVECEVTHPPSAEGRSVYLWLNDADVTTLLLELRDAARIARSAPLSARLTPETPPTFGDLVIEERENRRAE